MRRNEKQASVTRGIQRIGRYRIERRLGSGSFATAWLAYDPDLDVQVAIKVLANNWAADEDVKRRFLQEARMLFRLNDPRVIRVYTTGEHDDGCPYFVMDYADRGNLEERIAARRAARQPYALDEALHTCRAIADCLAVVHRVGIVHRDLKPSNVLYRSAPDLPDGERTVLGDFGIARVLEPGAKSTIVAGSPYYMAPEQAEEETAAAVDQRADIYAAAVILYELLTGRVPYPFATISEIRRAQEAGRFEPLEQLRAGVPPSVVAVVERGMALRPGDRPPSVEAWIREIDAALADLAAGHIAASPGEETLVEGTEDAHDAPRAEAVHTPVAPSDATRDEPPDASGRAMGDATAHESHDGVPTLIDAPGEEVPGGVPTQVDVPQAETSGAEPPPGGVPTLVDVQPPPATGAATLREPPADVPTLVERDHEPATHAGGQPVAPRIGETPAPAAPPATMDRRGAQTIREPPGLDAPDIGVATVRGADGETTDVAPVGPALGDAAPSRSRRKRPVFIAVALAALIVGGFAVTRALDDDPADQRGATLGGPVAGLTPQPAAPTATGARVPTPSIEPIETAAVDDDGMDLIVLERFDDPATSAFGTFSDEFATRSISGGRYQIAVSDQFLAWSYHAASSYASGYAVASVGLSGSGYAGVVARSRLGDDGVDTFEACWVSSAGDAGCALFVDGAWKPIFSVPAGTVVLSGGDVFAVEIDAGQLRFWVNDLFIGSGAVDPDISGSWGVLAGSFSGTVTGSFDDIELVRYTAGE